ncbi:hypothetical protein GE061_003090 [Apolygus lucorum]|uniref:Uncharacterized protein n=1 Tax=Apolygus lucorum TaxID=248454 RepID=A0A8S9X2I5_APOLU|nr:hypothetical protein GE061_003090 [Apolygus lucorum]
MEKADNRIYLQPNMERDPLNLNQFLQDFRDREDRSSFFTRARKSGFAFPLDSTPSLRFRDSATSSAVKRPFDDTMLNMNDSLIKRKRRLTLDDSAGSDSLNSTVGTPWETKHMRSALAQARAEVKSLEHKLGEISGKLKENILQQEQERNTYKTNLDRERTTINDMEKRIRVLKRREEKMRNDLSEAVQHVNQDRNDYENKMVHYHKENIELKQQMIECDAEKKRLELEVKTGQMECARLKSDLGSANEQVAAVSAQVSQLRNSLKESESVKSALADSLQRIKELESELHLQSENAAVVQAQQAKLMKYSELERQLKSLTNLNSKLKESSKHSFYLETVVDGLKDRLAMAEATEKELMQMRVQCGLVEAKLDEYKRAVEDVLGPGGTPTQLVHYIRKVQEDSLEVTNRHSQLQCRLKSLEETKATAEALTSKLNDEIANLQKELESSNSNFRRLKKQNALITWERNDLRSLVDSCQKEVTLGGLHDPRTEALEKLVEGYRKKLEQIENDPSLAPSSSTNTADAAELRKLKKENELLRQKVIKVELESQEGNKKVDPAQMKKLMDENLALKEKVEQMQYELEHRALRGDFNVQNTKILHFKMNPTSQAIEQRTDELEKLRTEVAQLRERLRLVSEGEVQDLTQNVANIINEDTTKELQELKEKVKNQDLANQRLTEAFKSTSREFREAIYALLGFKIDGLKNKTYRLCSLYSDSPQQFLLFKVNILCLL